MTFQTHGWVEHINGFDSFFSLLLVSKHQIKPEMQMPGDDRWLQGLSVDQHEQPGIITTPWGQGHMIDTLTILTHSKVKTCK